MVLNVWTITKSGQLIKCTYYELRSKLKYIVIIKSILRVQALLCSLK